jgi:hypothetical protein
MEQELFDKLVAEVKETVAPGMLSKGNKRTFGLADLWRIQKNRKYTGEYFRRKDLLAY